MKKIYSLFALITLVLVGFTQVGYAQGKETFETITKENTSYAMVNSQEIIMLSGLILEHLSKKKSMKAWLSFCETDMMMGH